MQSCIFITTSPGLMLPRSVAQSILSIASKQRVAASLFWGGAFGNIANASHMVATVSSGFGQLFSFVQAWTSTAWNTAPPDTDVSPANGSLLPNGSCGSGACGFGGSGSGVARGVTGAFGGSAWLWPPHGSAPFVLPAPGGGSGSVSIRSGAGGCDSILRP